MEGEEQRGMLDAWPGSATRLFKVHTQAYQKAFSASPCLGLSPSRLPGTSSNSMFPCHGCGETEA